MKGTNMMEINHNEHNSLFYGTLIESAELYLCVFSHTGVLGYLSQAAAQFIGYKTEEITRTNLLSYIHPNDVQAVRAAVVGVEQNQTIQISPFRLRHANGSHLWVGASLKNLSEEERVKGYVLNFRDVSGLIEKEQRHEIELSYYNSLFHKHPGFVFALSPGGIFHKVNANALKLLSYAESEIIGKHFSAFTAPSFTVDAAAALKTATDSKPSVVEGKVVCKDGTPKDFRFTLIPVYLHAEMMGILGIARDITSEKAARKEMEKLSLIASRAVNGVIMTDVAGKIEWVNSQFTNVTGYSLSEAMGKTPGQLLQGKDTDPATVQLMRELIQKKEPFYVEVLNYKKSGEKFWHGMDVIPMFDNEGNLVQYFAIQNDITERKEAEEKMLFLTEDLTSHNKELQQFIYIVSHNLRSPVANMLGLTSILEHVAGSPESFSKAIHNLKLTAQSLDTMLKDLSEILALRTMGKEVRSEKVCIASVCQEVLQSLQDKIESLGIEVSLSIPNHVCIQANRAYVYSIFHNLLSNAIKYRGQGRPLEVNISCTTKNQQYVIRFEDNGVGMDLQKVRKYLFRLYGKIDKKAEGRGLGLYMVKTQIESLNGTIDVKSSPDVGTSFTIRFNKDS